MRNIASRAEASMLEDARKVVRSQKATLNQLFRDWLAEVAGRKDEAERLSALNHRLDYVCARGPYNRDQMNGR